MMRESERQGTVGQMKQQGVRDRWSSHFWFPSSTLAEAGFLQTWGQESLEN